MVVSDQYLHPRCERFFNAFDAGDTVIDSQDDIGLMVLFCLSDDFRGQTVTVVETIGNHIVDVRAQKAKAAQGNGTGCCAVTIVIGDDGYFSARCNGIGQKTGCIPDMGQLSRRNHTRQAC